MSRHPSTVRLIFPLVALLLAPSIAAAGPLTVTSSDVVRIQALAVMSTPEGLQGVTSNVSVSFTTPGSGHIFLDTRPLAQVDMQGSARLAVRVASAYTGVPVEDKDFYIVVRGDSPVVGGPSAGGVLAVAATAALKGWSIRPGSFMTGTINLDGSIGPIGGLPQKAEAAAAEGGSVLVFPAGQEEVREAPGPFDRPAVVRMSEHCARLQLRCVPVEDLAEAVAEMTGYELVSPEPSGIGSSSAFRDQLLPLAEDSVRRARALLLDATRGYEGASISRSLRGQLDPALSAASREVFQAEAALDGGRPYTASSRSFRATIDANYVLESIRIAGHAAPPTALAELAERAGAEADAALAAVRDAPTPSFAALEAVGAAQVRAHEAQTWAAEARRSAEQGAMLEAVRLSVQALARADTARWWASLADRDDSGPVTAERVDALARDLVDNAQQTLAYASVLLGQPGGSGESRIATARDELDAGLAPAAVLDALQGENDVSVALSTAGLDEAAVEERLNRTLDRAAAAIARARDLGVEPFLAQSYLELAEDTADLGQALALASLAAALARVPGSLFGSVEPVPSRFVGGPPVPLASSAQTSAGAMFEDPGEAKAFGAGVLVAAVGTLGPMAALRWARRRDQGAPVASNKASAPAATEPATKPGNQLPDSSDPMSPPTEWKPPP